MTDEATAFVPGHVTGFFTVDRDEDPTRTGSRGAGLALTDGVTVTVESATESEVVLDGSPVEMEPATRVLDALDVRARVTAETPLPVGAGFGVSGAVALGTALSANAAFGCSLSENELVTVAHGAEVLADTGLGDVVAQARGGVPIRLEPGGPQHNLLDGIPARSRVEYLSFGELSTETVLASDTEGLTAAGQRALSTVVAEPTLETFTFASRRFARETDLLTPRVAETITAVGEAGGDAAMALLGDTVFALGTGLSDAGYDPEVCQVHPGGATLQP